VKQSDDFPAIELFFSQAPPGLCGCLVRVSLLERLIKGNAHPGKLLHYLPDQPGRDPISLDSCISVPTPVVRSLHRFNLDRSARSIASAEQPNLSMGNSLLPPGRIGRSHDGASLDRSDTARNRA